MKIFKFLFLVPVITLIIIFQTTLQSRYILASDVRDGETVFKNVCAGCHVRGGSVVLKGSKSLKLSDLEKRGIADVNSIAKIANDGIGFMKGYKNKMKIFKFLFVIPLITLIIIFQTSLQNRYLLASDLRDGETIFRNVCAGCHVRGGSVVLKGSKSLKLSDLEKRGIADVNSIAEIANEGIGYMKGYKKKLKDGEDKVLAQWIIQNAEKGWE